MKEEIVIPEGVESRLDKRVLTVIKGETRLVRVFDHPRVIVELSQGKIILSTKSEKRKDKRLIKTYKAHVNNLLKGVQEPFIYKLKVCSSHFPMDVSVQGKELVIKNFLGERKPRKAVILDGVNVKAQGDEIIVTGHDKESTGQTAANIEAATRLTLHDRRRFQDGIYMTVKAGELL